MLDSLWQKRRSPKFPIRTTGAGGERLYDQIQELARNDAQRYFSPFPPKSDIAIQLGEERWLSTAGRHFHFHASASASDLLAD